MKIKTFLVVLFVSILPMKAFSEGEIVRHPLNIGVGLEFGQFMRVVNNQQTADTLSGDFFNRLGMGIVQKMTAYDKFEMSLGLGGIFFNKYPLLDGSDWALATQVGNGIIEASAILHFGDFEKRNLYLQFGFFPIKYNDNALNLGEYLFRSGTYPANLFTGGPGFWQLVNGARIDARGARLHWDLLDGMFSQDLTFLIETDFPPAGNITPSYFAKFNAGNVFQIGAGMSFSHLFAFRPSQLRPKNRPENHFVEIYNVPPIVRTVTVKKNNTGALYLDSGNFEIEGTTLKGLAGDLQNLTFVDTNGLNIVKARAYHSRFNPNDIVVADATPQTTVFVNRLTGDLVDPDFVATQTNEDIYLNTNNNTLMLASQVPDINDPTYVYQDSLYAPNNQISKYSIEGDYVYQRKDYTFTHRGIKLMGMLSFDPKPLFGSPEILSPEDLKIFAEFAVLGVQNQPLYYEEITERMPFMFGINLPTFRLLDLFSIQGEYYKNKWWPSDRSINRVHIPIPYFSTSESPYNWEPINYDNWKWSVFAKRKWTFGNIYLQVASDHLRTHPASFPHTFFPLTIRPKDWYYVFRIEYGL